MTPTQVYDTYWRFAAERLRMYYRRLVDPAGPWTNDPILRAYRFTNSFRAADRVSQYLIGEVQYRLDRSQEPQELFFRTLLFKMFNRIDTWEAIERQLGPLTWKGGNIQAIRKVLDERMSSGHRVYSAAYIMPAPAFGHARKHANHLALLTQMMDDRLPDRLRQAPSLKAVYKTLLNYTGLGPFLAFQYAIDLNYSTILDFGEDEFVVAGPGANDGISKCFSDVAGRSPEAVIRWVTERQDREFARLDLNFEGLFGRRLQPIDCQNLFCEISKYARVAHPEVEGVSGRTRIKQGFEPNPRPAPAPVFPPRWALNLPDQMAAEAPARCARPVQARLF
jgi:hypothetical protein